VNGGGQGPAPLGGGVLGVAEPEHYGVLVAHQGAAALEVGEKLGAAAGDQAELHRGGLAGGLGLRLVEVGVPVQEQQAGAGAAPQGQGDAEQDGAVAAEHDRDCLGVLGGAEGVDQRDGVVAQPLRVEQTCRRVDLGSKGGAASRGPGRAPSRAARPAASRAWGSRSTPGARRPRWEGAWTMV
jgi:hypothetical protein